MTQPGPPNQVGGRPEPPNRVGSEPVVTIYLVNAVRTSQGPGPGVQVLPASEAGALIASKYAIYGDRAPEPVRPEPVVRAFRHVPLRRSASSN